jgi:excisionase family DNA binding protein
LVSPVSLALSLSTLAEMRHMEELTTAEIAARIGVSPRAVQRWIKSGKLPALPLANHRYAVNTSDLKHLALPEHVSETGEIVLEAMKLQVPLEEKLEDLRFTVDDLMSRLHDAESKIERLQYRLDQIGNRDEGQCRR